ncbi:MAG: hypothetical protein SNJ33_00190 [Rikenellaceae bacterium]
MRLYILLAAVLMTSSQLFAQVDKSVEVTREYIPQLERAVKPTLQAEVVDTTTIRPDVDYTIVPLSISTSVATKPLEPAQVTYWQFSQPDNFAIKAGFGYPLTTLFDGYYSRYNADSGYFLGYVNHYGEYVDLSTPFSDDNFANRQSNSVGIAGGVHIAERKLRTSINYSNDIYHRSAAYIESRDESRINYQDINAMVSFGDDFIDLSRWNFSLGFDVNHFWNSNNNYNALIGGGLKMAREFSKGSSFNFNVGYHTLVIGEDSQSRSASDIDIDFTYGYTKGDWQMGVGLIYRSIFNQYLDSDGEEKSSSLFTPQAYLRYTALRKTVLFVEMGGEMIDGTYASMAKLNPYISSSDIGSMRSTTISNLRFGAEGALMSRNQLSYRLYAQGELRYDDMLWVLVVDPMQDNYNYMAVDYINETVLSLNLEAEYRIIPQLSLATDLHLYHFSDWENESGYEYGRSSFVGGVSLDYSLPKFNIGVSAQSRSAYGVSYIYDYIKHDVLMPATVDLGCYFDFKVGDATIFFEANNLINQTIYNYYGYRELGMNFMAGVKLSF